MRRCKCAFSHINFPRKGTIIMTNRNYKRNRPNPKKTTKEELKEEVVSTSTYREKAKKFYSQNKKVINIVGAAVVVVAVAVVASKAKNNGKLVKLVGEAATDYANFNKSSMTPKQTQIKVKLLKNPGKVLVDAAKKKTYILINGELAAINFDVKGMSEPALNELYLASANEGFGGNISGYFYTRSES